MEDFRQKQTLYVVLRSEPKLCSKIFTYLSFTTKAIGLHFVPMIFPTQKRGYMLTVSAGKV